MVSNWLTPTIGPVSNCKLYGCGSFVHSLWAWCHMQMQIRGDSNVVRWGVLPLATLVREDAMPGENKFSMFIHLGQNAKSPSLHITASRSTSKVRGAV